MPPTASRPAIIVWKVEGMRVPSGILENLSRGRAFHHVHQTLCPRGKPTHCEHDPSNLYRICWCCKFDWKCLLNLLNAIIVSYCLHLSCKFFGSCRVDLRPIFKIWTRIDGGECVHHEIDKMCSPLLPPRPSSSAASWGLSWWWLQRPRWSRWPSPRRHPGQFQETWDKANLFLNACIFLFNILGLTATRTGRAAPAVMTVITPPATVSPPASTPPPDPTTWGNIL